MQELSETGKKLARKLKEISNDRNFICGTMSNATGDESWKKILSFIDMAEKRNDEVTTDDILRLSIILGQEASNHGKR